MSSIFAPQPKAPTPSLFPPTSNATQQSSLFGASGTTQPSGGLFGSGQPAQSNGLFGASNAQSQQPANTSSLFGGQPQQNQASTGFGAPPQQNQSSSLFGAQPQQKQSSSLPGAQPQQNQPSSLFGAQPQQNQSGGLFGASLQQQQQQNQSGGPFGASQQQQQQPNSFASGSLSSGLQSTGVGALNAQTQRELAQSRLQSAGLNSSAREKTVPQQISTLVQKWDPTHHETLLQTYLYNAANPAFAPFYYPAPNESERDYEAALAKKPEPIDGNTWVPLLVRGFKNLGERIEYQARFVQNMQVRLHEMNNALTAIMQKHAQDLSVRVDAAKRQHAALSQRTLKLAVKCQVLRNRGYALDGPEEGLRTTLLALADRVQDSALSSREEEIWARMVVLRERTRWLEEEGKRVGAAVEAQKESGNARIPASVVESAKRILRDYDTQLRQLAREMQEVHADFKEWEESRKG